jgi:hypothetical protein
MTLEPQANGASIIERVKAILLQPKVEWPRIDAEPATVASIFRGWVVILAAIPPLAHLIGSLLFGMGAFGFNYRPSIGDALATLITNYILSLVSVFVLGLIIDALAPTFGGTKNSVQAFKVAAYAMTAAWIAGIFNLFPQLGILVLVGSLYSLYLLYLGLPLLMKAAADKAVTYTVAVIVAAIVLGLIVGAVTAAVTSSFMGARGLMPMAASSDAPSGTVTVPGMGTVDLGKLDAAAKKMEAASQRTQSGTQAPIEPARLQALLPENLGAYQRTEVSSAGAGSAGIGGSTAEARYKNGDNDLHVTVSDISAMGAIAAMGSAFNVQSNRQTQTGYEKTGTIDGRMTSEKWDSQSGRGSFSVLVADRFMIEAEGRVPSIDTLKGAVNAVGIARLEALKG